MVRRLPLRYIHLLKNWPRRQDGSAESIRHLRKWLVLGVVIGIVAGLGAVAFYNSLQLANHYLLMDLGGYRVPQAATEGGDIGSSGFSRPWAIPLVVGLGGLVSGILVFAIAPEARGHGTDAAIAAVHHNPKGIRVRAVLVKIVASAITIGSGGSAGREGPSAQISAGFGSMLSRWLRLSEEDSRTAVTVGIASGIGAIFSAPLGGAVLGAELVYRDDIEASALLPSLFTSVVAFAIFGAFEGYQPIFGQITSFNLDNPFQLPYFIVVGIVAGFVGRLYPKIFYGVESLFRKMAVPVFTKPAIGGVIVGLIGLSIPAVLGTGYGFLQQAMGPGIAKFPLWMIIAIPFAKIVATSLSIGSGGSGGIFGPGMVIGGFAGGAVYRVLALFAPNVPHHPVVFVLVGMAASFGTIAHAPFAILVMVVEMTGNLSITVPSMIAIAFSALIIGDKTIYRSQLIRRLTSSEVPTESETTIHELLD